MPKGYQKVYEKEITFGYSFPKNFPAPESHKLVYEVLDGIMNDTLGFHLLEPRAKVTKIPKAVPQVKHKSSTARTGQMLYMKAIDRKNYAQERQKMVKEKSKKKSRRKVLDTTYKTPLRLVLKLELVNFPKNDQGIAKNCAHVLEDLLQGVESGSDKLKNTSKKIMNKTLLKRQKQKKKEREERRDKEKKRKEHALYIKEEFKQEKTDMTLK